MKYIEAYLQRIESGTVPVCEWQHKLALMIRRIFSEETEIWIDEEQAEKYLSMQKYFPFELLEWERFCFVLHNCVYRSDGELRFPILFLMVARGTGKNGYLTFEDFCLLTPINGIKDYDISIFATGEDQARTSFDEVYSVLEENENKMRSHFKWTKECITNLKTNSKLRYRTANSKTKDGGREGKVDFDEVHQYENYKLIDVAVTGLGKKKHPRRTYITTDGYVRDGVLDDMKAKAEDILNGVVPDMGLLPFICKLDSDDEIIDPKMWIKANPSIDKFPNLYNEMLLELEDYKRDPIANSSFATKRCNRPTGDRECGITEWENIKACSEIDVPDLTGCSCVCGLDFSQVTDFTAAVLLFFRDGMYYCIQHTWICKESKDLPKIHFPYEVACKRGDATLVDDVEINIKDIIDWVAEMSRQYKIINIACDTFRYSVFKDELKKIGFESNKDKNKSRVSLLRLPGDLMLIAPKVSTIFNKHLLGFGDVPIMRWYFNNVKKSLDPKGNVKFEKIEQQSRKTDGAMAFLHALTQAERLETSERIKSLKPLGARTY